jgi:predicted DNA-binding transcriptional regulator YafY
MPKPPPSNGPRLVVDNTPSNPLHKLLIQVITTRHQVSFVYQDKLRIVEPHDYGLQNGSPRLLSYQTGGQSGSGQLPNWRMFEINKMSDFKILEERFAGNRPAKQHYQWDKLFIRVGEPE